MQKHLAQLLDAHREELASNYQRMLRETMFLNRAEVRPALLKGIASDEVGALLAFLQQPSFSGAEHGAQLFQVGLGEQAIVRLGKIMRQFFLPYMEEGQTAQMLELVDTYQEAVIQGYIKRLEESINTEQVRTVNALQRANNWS